MSILEVKKIRKTYQSRFGGNRVEALRDVTFSVEPGEYVAIMGESGSGKTTLLNILAALDQPTGGEVVLDRIPLNSVSDAELAKFRRENLGFVFQEYNLLDTLNLRDNILLPLVLDGQEVSTLKEKLKEVVSVIGIQDLMLKYPFEVSGGQKQRAAVARALITHPSLILADEPTGALDSQSTSDLLRVFRRINQKGQTILMVTHSVNAAAHADRVMFIKDGVVFHQLYRGKSDDQELYQKITDTLSMLRRGGER